MKKLITVLILLWSINSCVAQNVNWNSYQENQTSFTYLNFGYDFGVVTQIGYGKRIDGFRPILLNVDYSFPMGKNLIDDFKVRLGGQISIFEKNNFIASAKIYAIARRHETNFVRMTNFGSEVGIVAGYYKPKWHLAIDFGLDKSAATHLKHTEKFSENNPNLEDGWLIPSGGNFIYGLQGSRTIGEKFEFSLRAGATNALSKDENALLPYYTQLGFIWKFDK